MFLIVLGGIMFPQVPPGRLFPQIVPPKALKPGRPLSPTPPVKPTRPRTPNAHPFQAPNGRSFPGPGVISLERGHVP